jgi:hypothetical protein
MALSAVARYTLIIAPFIVQIVMLSLQWDAYRRYSHRSFLILSTATVLGLLFLATPYAYRWWNGDGMPISVTAYAAWSAALLLQCILAVWGTASLFRSYGALAAATTRGPEAPNNRSSGRDA